MCKRWPHIIICLLVPVNYRNNEYQLGVHDYGALSIFNEASSMQLTISQITIVDRSGKSLILRVHLEMNLENGGGKEKKSL